MQWLLTWEDGGYLQELLTIGCFISSFDMAGGSSSCELSMGCKVTCDKHVFLVQIQE